MIPLGQVQSVVSFNALSLVDLFGPALGVFVSALFLYRSLRVGVRNNPEFLFALQVLFVVFYCICVFFSDNGVPATITASTLIDSAPKATLEWYRRMFVAGNFMLATMTHFAISYAEHKVTTYSNDATGILASRYSVLTLLSRSKIVIVYSVATALS